MFDFLFPKEWSTLKKLIWLKAKALAHAVLKTIIGNPIHITDALAKPVQALSISLEPIQDLHGYDNPWPSGGGKNKLQTAVASGELNGVLYTVNSDGSVKLGGTATANTYIVVGSVALAAGTYTVNGISDSTTNTVYVQITDGPMLQQLAYTANGDKNFTLSEAQTVVYRIAVMNGVSPTDTIYPMIRLSSVADATFAPYSNLCPIYGHTDADVWDDPKYGGLIEWNQYVKAPDFSASKYFVSHGNGNVVDGVLEVESTGTGNCYISSYIGSCQASHSFLACVDVFLDSRNAEDYQSSTITLNWALGGYRTAQNPTKGEWGKLSVFLNPSSVGDRITFYVLGTATTTAGEKLKIKNPQLFDLTQMFGEGNEPSTVEEFEALFPKDYYAYDSGTQTTVSAVNGDPYRHYPIPLGTTVYGSTLVATHGKLTVDRAIVDMGTLSWVKRSTSGTHWRFTTQDVADLAWGEDSAQVPKGMICSIYEAITPTQTYRGVMGVSSHTTMTQLLVCDETYTDAASFTTAMSGVQLVYTLATPQTIQLTPQQVELLQGENNIWSDGEMTLVYLADGNASDEEALNILLGGRYVNNHTEDEPTDREALDILLGGTR